MNIGQKFLEGSKYQNLLESPQKQGKVQPPLELNLPKECELIELPGPQSLEIPKVDLVQLIEARETRRKYLEKKLSLEELSYLLWLTQGVKQVTERPSTIRNVPSAGARHPYETYLLINAVEGLKNGLYRYVALSHKLLLVDDTVGLKERITQACLKQKQVLTSAVTFIWVAAIKRMFWRYSERAYRYVLLDAGHICQNLYLAAEAINCGVCAIAAYDDDLLNSAIKVDGKELVPLYLASLGKVK